MVALITSVLGAAIPCRRAARLGVSPERQLFLPGAAAHLPDHHQPGMDPQAHGQLHPPLLRQAGIELAHGLHASPARPARPAGRHLRAPGGSRSRRAGHRRDTGRYARQSGRSPWRRCLDRPAPPRAGLRGRAASTSAVESTRSQNSTVSWRRSASGGAEAAGGGAGRDEGAAGETGVAVSPVQTRTRPVLIGREALALDELVFERFQVRRHPAETATGGSDTSGGPAGAAGRSPDPPPRQSPPRLLPAWCSASVLVCDSIIA